jgi:hypothetical protein
MEQQRLPCGVRPIMPNKLIGQCPILMPVFHGTSDWRSGMTCGSFSGVMGLSKK